MLLDDVLGKALLVGEGAVTLMALLRAVQGRMRRMQRLVLQMGSQAARVREPLVAPVALEGHNFGGRKVFGGPLEVENSKHNKNT